MTTAAGPTTPEYRRLRNLLIFVSILIAVTVGAIWLDGRAQRAADHRRAANDTYRQCLTSNNSRQEITLAFDGLYDGFIKASGNSQAAIDFKNEHMASLESALPQRECVKP